MQAPAVAITGESFNCCERYVSDWEVAQAAKEFTGSASEILGCATFPRHQIETTKLKRLGMQFGGDRLFRETLSRMLEGTSS